MKLKRLITGLATAGIALPLAALAVPAEAAATCVLGSPSLNTTRVVLGTVHNKSVTVKVKVTNCTPTNAKGLKIAWWPEGIFDGDPIANLKGSYAGSGVYDFSAKTTLDPDDMYNELAGVQDTFLAKTKNTIYQEPSQKRAVPDWRILRASKMAKPDIFKFPGWFAPTNVRKGQKLEIYPNLSRADWEADKYRYYNATVTLQFKSKSGSYKNLATGKLDSSGHGFAAKATVDGYYRFVFKGNGTTNKVTSSGRYLDVK